MKTIIAAFVATMLLSANPSNALAGGNQNAKSIYRQATKTLLVLMENHPTRCFFVKDDDGAQSLIFTAPGVRFANAGNKYGWLSLWVIAVGTELNYAPKVNISHVYFMNDEMARDSTYFHLPAEEAARLHRELKAKRINEIVFYRSILAAGKIWPVHTKHLAAGTASGHLLIN